MTNTITFRWKYIKLGLFDRLFNYKLDWKNVGSVQLQINVDNVSHVESKKIPMKTVNNLVIGIHHGPFFRINIFFKNKKPLIYTIGRFHYFEICRFCKKYNIDLIEESY